MKSAAVLINGIQISYYLKPVSRAGLSVVFIHGFPFNKDIWKYQLGNLPEQVQGIAYDVRGHGESGAGHTHFSINLFAQDLISFLKALELERIVLCGISMGGYIALRALELTSENIVGLVLCDTHPKADSNDIKLSRFEGIETIISKGKEVYADNFIKKLFAANTIAARPQAIELIRNTILSNKTDNICATLLALASRTDTAATLKDINIPTLIIRGKEDALVAHDMAALLHGQIPHSGFHTIQGAGHLPNLENPDEFNLLLNSFLKSL